MSGVIEPTSMVWGALLEARLRKKSMVEIWLDLANAYGSIPHALIKFALKRYGICDTWVELIMNYYDGLWTRLSTTSAQSGWRRLEKGIFAGCTLSVILFLAGFNIIIEFVNAKTFPTFTLHNGNSLPLLRGFMDDLSVMTTSVPRGKEILERVQIVLAWARMKPKASKSRSCVLVKGRCMNVEPFTLGGETIPSLQRKPTTGTLGRNYDASLNDTGVRGI